VARQDAPASRRRRPGPWTLPCTRPWRLGRPGRPTRDAGRGGWRADDSRGGSVALHPMAGLGTGVQERAEAPGVRREPAQRPLRDRQLLRGKRSQGQTSLQWELKPTVPPSQCGRQCLPGSPAQRITSFAWKRSVGGMVRPRVWAVLRLMTNSNCVSCSTGRSAGLAPRRILST